MKKLSLQIIKESLNKKIFQRIDQKIMVYLIFVGIATVIWFLTELGNDFTTTIDYPVRYANLPKNKVLVQELPKNLQLSVNGYGFTLLRYKVSPAPFPVVIDLNDYATQINNPRVRRFPLLTRYARQTINKQMPNNIEVLDIFPDTIVFEFANVVEKKVAIAPNVKLEFDKQSMLDGKISFTPDSIIVSGPNTLLDTLQYVYNKKQTFTGLNKPLQRNIQLKEIDNLSFSKKRVIINLPVSKFTEAYFEVPIETVNVPDSLVLKTFPRVARLTFLVSLNKYDKIKPDDFRVEANYNDIKELLGQKLPIKLTFSPEPAHSVTYHPENVEFILEKNND